MLVLKLLPLLLATVLPTVRAQPAKCEKKEFAETQAKYQQCAAAKIASISKALEVRESVTKCLKVFRANTRWQSRVISCRCCKTFLGKNANF